MARTKMIKLGELAQDVLSTVEAADLGKKSEMTYTKKASAATQVGGLVEKVAEQMRLVKPTEITYDDLQNFRKRYGV
jgi:hypothetical protein